MRLSTKQQQFTVAIGKLIGYASSKGYGLTFGDAMRDPRLHGELGVKKGYGARNSNHKVRLAVDFNLFVNGEYITSGTHPAYKDLGAKWKTLHELAEWGGEGKRNDANHFSFNHNGQW